MRIEQREDIVIIDGLEISGTIQKKINNARVVKIPSSMMTRLIVIFVRCVMSGKRRHVMTRIVTIVFNVQNAHCKSIAKFFSFLVFDKEFTIRYSN